jgi:hypothetical protein
LADGLLMADVRLHRIGGRQTMEASLSLMPN